MRQLVAGQLKNGLRIRTEPDHLSVGDVGAYLSSCRNDLAPVVPIEPFRRARQSQKIIAQGTDWRFLNELKKELKA